MPNKRKRPVAILEMRGSEYPVAFIQIVSPYFLQKMRNKTKGRGLLQYSRGEGSGPEYSVAFIQNHGGRSRRGGLKFRSGVELRNMVMIHSEGIRNFYSALNILEFEL